MPSLVIVPLSLPEANAFVELHHRHHRPCVGHKFSVGAAVGGEIVGVAIVGRPVSRVLDDGMTLEVNRVATDGTRNACSALYGACRRATFALGYTRLLTYTLPAEGGASLRASGFRLLGTVGREGRNWNTPSRPRIDTAVVLRGQKLLWEA